MIVFVIILVIVLVVVFCVINNKKSKEKTERRIEELKNSSDNATLWKSVYCPLFNAWQKLRDDDGLGNFLILFTPDVSNNARTFSAKLEGEIDSGSFMFHIAHSRDAEDKRNLIQTAYGLSDDEYAALDCFADIYTEAHSGTVGLSKEKFFDYIPAQDVYCYCRAFARTIHENCPHLDVYVASGSGLSVVLHGNDHAGIYSEN